jgi:DNA polymerase III delta prime subunit
VGDLPPISLVVSIAIVGAITLWLIKLDTRRKSLVNPDKIKADLIKVNELAKTKATAKYAVVEADKLLDSILQLQGYGGDKISERMKSSEVTRKDQALWDAHKLRNQIVHETDFSPSTQAISRALSAYNSSIKKMVKGL